jgi:hypothetical protein
VFGSVKDVNAGTLQAAAHANVRRAAAPAAIVRRQEQVGNTPVPSLCLTSLPLRDIGPKPTTGQATGCIVPSLCLGALPRRDLGPKPTSDAPKECSTPSSSSSSTARSDSSSPAPAGGTPAARLRAAEAARNQPCNVALKLDLSRVLPPASTRGKRPGMEMLTPGTPRGREPVRRQDVERVSEVCSGGSEAPVVTPRSATVVPLTARGSGPLNSALRQTSQPSLPVGSALCNSARRVGSTPREYVIEVLTEARAHELVASATSPRGSLRPPLPGSSKATDSISPRSPSSPPIMLRPSDAPISGVNAEGQSPGSVSASSSEGEIRDRLRLGLQQEAGQSCDKAMLAELKFPLCIPTPARSRFSAGSNAQDSCDSDNSEEHDAFPDEGCDLNISFAPASASAWEPPPTPRR